MERIRKKPDFSGPAVLLHIHLLPSPLAEEIEEKGSAAEDDMPF